MVAGAKEAERRKLEERARKKALPTSGKKMPPVPVFPPYVFGLCFVKFVDSNSIGVVEFVFVRGVSNHVVDTMQPPCETCFCLCILAQQLVLRQSCKFVIQNRCLAVSFNHTNRASDSGKTKSCCFPSRAAFTRPGLG